jgi:hypothetical protein
MHTVFISYARKDREHLERLLASVRNIERSGDAEFWYDDKIPGGREFEPYLNEHIYRADLFLPLVSLNFLASDWCSVKELHAAYERTKLGRCHIMPIVLSACDWTRIPLELQCAAGPGAMVKQLGELHTHLSPQVRLDTVSNPDVFFDKAHRAIRRMLEEMTSRSSTREIDPLLPTRRRVIDLNFGKSFSRCELVEVQADGKSFWIGARPLPAMKRRGEPLRIDHPFIRASATETLRIIQEVSRDKGIDFRAPTSAEWRYALTLNGRSQIAPNRPPPSGRDACWGDYRPNELEIYCPCRGADEWVADSYDGPDKVATLHLGQAGPEASICSWSGPYPGTQPAIRLLCEVDPSISGLP